MATYKTPPDLVALAQQLKALRTQARELGLFTDDRDLLTCPTCGLQEDVTIDGYLITYDCDCSDAHDSGLRFDESENGHFVCPRCNTCIVADEPE